MPSVYVLLLDGYPRQDSLEDSGYDNGPFVAALSDLGFEVHADARSDYPRTELADIDRSDIDLVLLPDEPYVFTADDGPEAFTHVPTVLVSGRALTWYGPSMLTAKAALLSAIG